MTGDSPDRPERVDRSRPPQPEAEHAFSFPPFSRQRLAGGPEVLMARLPRLPLVRMDFLVPAGAQQEPAAKAGLATLTAGLVDEGTARSTATDIARRMERLGASLSTGAGWNAGSLDVSLLSRHLEVGLETIAELAREASFPDEEVARLRKQRLGALLQESNDPRGLAERCLSRAIYGEGIYGRSMLGSRASVEGLTRQDAADFYRRHYGVGAGFLMVVGDVEPDELLEPLSRFFAAAAAQEARPAPSLPNFLVSPLEEVEVHVVDRPEGSQTELRLGHAGVPRSSDDFTGLGVLNAILGGKFTSRINLNLREKKGYTYGAQSRFVPRQGPGPFVISTAVATEVTGAAVTEVLAELERIRQEEVTEEELSDTRSYLRGMFLNHLQTIDDVIGRLSTLVLFGLADDHYERYLQEVAAIEADTLLDLARRHLHPDRLAIVAVGPAAQLRPQLEGFGPLRVWTPEELV